MKALFSNLLQPQLALTCSSIAVTISTGNLDGRDHEVKSNYQSNGIVGWSLLRMNHKPARAVECSATDSL